MDRGRTHASEPRPPPRPRARVACPGSRASVLAAVALGLGIAAYRATRLADAQKTQARLTIALPPGQEIISYPAITRDGRTIAYVTQQGASETQLYLRDLNAFEARPVPGSNGARQPFFSPDGKWVAFFARGFIQKAEVAGGAPIRVVEAPYSQGGTWNEDNTIIYAASLGSGLLRVPAGGGTPESLTKPDGAANGYAHVFPQALPGGRDVLFAAWGQKQGTAVLSLASRKWELVLPSTSFAWGVFDPAGGSGGRLLLVNESGDMRAAPFDACSSRTHQRRYHGRLQRLLRRGNRIPRAGSRYPTRALRCMHPATRPGCRWCGWTAREGARR